MKAAIRLTLFTIAIAGAADAAPFQNLNFEQARTNSVTPSLSPVYPGQGTGPVTDLLPSWQLSRNGQPVATIDYNNLGDNFPIDHVSVVGPRPPRPSTMEGQFHAAFTLLTRDQYILTQRGDVPPGALTLSFQYRSGPFVASINGESISPSALPFTGLTPATVVVDVSRFAGQNVELSFRPLFLVSGTYELDNIGFIVPEPSTTVLFAVGVFALVGRSVRRRFG